MTEIFWVQVVAHFHDQNTPGKLLKLDFHLIYAWFIYYLTSLGIYFSILQGIIGEQKQLNKVLI